MKGAVDASLGGAGAATSSQHGLATRYDKSVDMSTGSFVGSGQMI